MKLIVTLSSLSVFRWFAMAVLSVPGRSALLTAAIVMVVPIGALGQPLVCSPIVRGDSASSLARRLTGDPAAAYSHLFQIRDPARRVFVPKSRYRWLSPGWQVCVAREIRISSAKPAEATPRAVSSGVIAPIAPAIAASDLPAPVPAARPTPRPVARYDLAAAVRIGVAVSLLLFAGTLTVRWFPSSPPPPDLQQAGAAFVGAFAAPLIDPGSTVPPILARLRYIRRSEQLDIFLAPNHGRRYPNLLDHKWNVEYDVHRVLRLLGPRVTLSRPLRAEGKWVVVPIRLVQRKETGA